MTGSGVPGSDSGSHVSSQSRLRMRTSRHASQSVPFSGAQLDPGAGERVARVARRDRNAAATGAPLAHDGPEPHG